MTAIREIASGLRFPEGPIALADGSVLLVELARGTLTRVDPSGRTAVVATLPGGPNGAAIGPDGKVYVCNNGGCFGWFDSGDLLIPTMVSDAYSGGSIQRVDLASGAVETLYTHAGDVKIRAPNDIVFDRSGGFWFTDHGQVRARERDRTGLFYARPDGRTIHEAAFPMDFPNGIGLSPDESTLYVSETFAGRVWKFAIGEPGRLIPSGAAFPEHGGTLLYGAPDYTLFDSLAVDSAGNVCVASPSKGAVVVIAPDGQKVAEVQVGAPMASNICFGGRDLRTAYVTLGGPGRLVALEWPRAGAPTAFTHRG